MSAINNDLSRVRNFVSVNTNELKNIQEEMPTMEQPLESNVSSSELKDTNASAEEEVALRTEELNDPLRSLDAYCQQFCGKYKIGRYEAQQRIIAGQQLIKGIYSHSEKISLNAKESQRQLANITWFLMCCALLKGQGFNQGSFVIEDREILFKNLFMTPQKYDRGATHFNRRSPEKRSFLSRWFSIQSSSQFGIPVLNGSMPADKRTILFQQIQPFPGTHDTMLLFFKPEDYDLCWSSGFGTDMIWHGVQTIKSMSNRSEGKGKNDLPNMRKEHLPDEVKNAFYALLREIKFGKEKEIYKQISLEENIKMETVKEAAEIWGIAFIHKFMTCIKGNEKCPRDFNEKIKPLYQLIEPLGNIEKRTGREVYITWEELENLINNDIPWERITK